MFEVLKTHTCYTVFLTVVITVLFLDIKITIIIVVVIIFFIVVGVVVIIVIIIFLSHCF